MKLISSLKELKLGQIVAWRCTKLVDEEEGPVWVYITKVKGFHNKTTYPQKANGLIYQIQEYIDYDILTQSKAVDEWGYNILLGRYKNLKRGPELETTFEYDKMFQAWLLENERDHLEVLKAMLVDNL